MDWFERITGFLEEGYEATRSNLLIAEDRLHSIHSDRSFGVGRLETPTLADLRRRTAGMSSGQGPTRVSCVQGDVRRMHRDANNAGALFQVASQFNLLEMVGHSVSPEDGATRYQSDPTQGPPCAIAAGAGTIYRNYFAPVDGHFGQRTDRQFDCLQGIGKLLGNEEGSLWTMRNGYCLTTDDGLAEIDGKLRSLDAGQLDDLKGHLRIGMHWSVEVTDERAGHLVSQAYCSALPVSYNRIRQRANWARFAGLVLEAAYEATLLSAVLNRHAKDRPVIYLTRLGGGAFGNDATWISAAMRRSLIMCRDAALDVRIVSYADATPDMLDLAAEFKSARR